MGKGEKRELENAWVTRTLTPVSTQPYLLIDLWGVYTIQQTSSKLPANVFKIHVLMLDVCWIV